MIDKEYVTIALSRLYPEGCLFKGNPDSETLYGRMIDHTLLRT